MLLGWLPWVLTSPWYAVWLDAPRDQVLFLQVSDSQIKDPTWSTSTNLVDEGLVL